MNFGSELIDSINKAQHEILIVSPYIKKDVLHVIINNAITDKISITCITRWKPEDVAFGVSDLEIMDLIRNIDNARLMLNPDLHAKYYRIDDHCFIGSANLTQNGIGWSKKPNLELMYKVKLPDENIANFEENVLLRSVTATEEHRKLIEELSNNQSIKTLNFSMYNSEQENSEQYATEKSDLYSVNSLWLPLCSRPEELYNIYSEQIRGNIIESIIELGKRDIAYMGIPLGLDEDAFWKYCKFRLLQMPAILIIDEILTEKSLKDSEAIDILEKKVLNPAYDISDLWENTKKWVKYFFSNRYRIRTSEFYNFL